MISLVILHLPIDDYWYTEIQVAHWASTSENLDKLTQRQKLSSGWAGSATNGHGKLSVYRWACQVLSHCWCWGFSAAWDLTPCMGLLPPSQSLRHAPSHNPKQLARPKFLIEGTKSVQIMNFVNNSLQTPCIWRRTFFTVSLSQSSPWLVVSTITLIPNMCKACLRGIPLSKSFW